MKYEDFIYQFEKRENLPEKKDNLIAKRVLQSYLDKSDRNRLPRDIAGNYIEDLFYNYFLLKDKRLRNDLISVMHLFDFNYTSSIHNTLYYLLATPYEFDSHINPLLWPGIININEENSKYILETVYGSIEVYKASEILKNTKSSYIFDKKLMNHCYERTYDFLKENNDYLAVLSYMPNYFYGGHYHVYLEKGDTTLDIAANTFYESKKYSSKVLNGEIIEKLSFEQVELQMDEIIKNIKDFSDDNNPKLLTLTLYHDMKKNKK